MNTYEQTYIYLISLNKPLYNNSSLTQLKVQVLFQKKTQHTVYQLKKILFRTYIIQVSAKERKCIANMLLNGTERYTQLESDL